MTDWRDRARCRSEDPELFFPVGQGAEAAEQERAAMAVCRPCPVRLECLAWALTVHEAGVWGGTSEAERRRIRRERRTA